MTWWWILNRYTETATRVTDVAGCLELIEAHGFFATPRLATAQELEAEGWWLEIPAIYFRRPFTEDHASRIKDHQP